MSADKACTAWCAAHLKELTWRDPLASGLRIDCPPLTLALSMNSNVTDGTGCASDPPDIGPWQLAVALSLMGFVILVSLRFRLRMAGVVALAALRTTLQLLLLGYILTPVFQWQHIAPVLVLCCLMVLVAARETYSRVAKVYPGMFLHTLESLFLSTVTASALAVLLIIEASPWWSPRFLIPSVGMLLGNALKGITLGLNAVTQELSDGRANIELLLAMGASKWEASQHVIRNSIRTGLLPQINSMMIIGLVSIPGMMTGQIMGGTPPGLAARYQIIIMFLIGFVTATSLLVTVYLAVAANFDEEHRLRADYLVRQEPSKDVVKRMATWCYGGYVALTRHEPSDSSQAGVPLMEVATRSDAS